MPTPFDPNSEPEHDSADQQETAPRLRARIEPVIGTLLVFAGAGLAAVAIGELVLSMPINMPWLWRLTPELWIGLGVVMFCLGVELLRSSAVPATDIDTEPDQPAFSEVVIYSKPDCPLCDEAKAVLDRHAKRLPPIHVIDISGRSDLYEKHRNEIPVVVMDGRIRFRGRVSEPLLLRMLDAAARGDLDRDPHGRPLRDLS